MKFLIAKASKEQLTFGDTEGLFTNDHINFYNYSVDLEEDCIRITDSCNRMLPIDYNEVSTFAKLFLRLAAYQQAKLEMEEELYDILTEGTDVISD